MASEHNFSINDGVHGELPSIAPEQLGIIASFMALSMWIVLEFHVRIFRLFTWRRSLYFWSLMVLAWGILLHRYHGSQPDDGMQRRAAHDLQRWISLELVRAGLSMAGIRAHECHRLVDDCDGGVAGTVFAVGWPNSPRARCKGLPQDYAEILLGCTSSHAMSSSTASCSA